MMPFENKNKNSISSSGRPLRILHVLYKMDRGGAETWLMNILRHIDRERFHLDFLVHDPAPGAYDAEAQSLGARVIYCPYPLWPWTYVRKFKKILGDYGPYDIIHSQISLGGYYLALASQAGVPVRIAHTHVEEFWRRLGFLKKTILKLSNFLIKRYASGGLAVSRLAAAGRFGPDWEADPRWQVLYCGIDLNPFRENIDPQVVRQEFGIPAGVLVIGHVGRFDEQKNHRFIIKIALEISRTTPDFRLLLVGVGPLRPDIERLVDQCGLKDKIIFTGPRPDVPRLMLGAMDVFVFPSNFEGLPLAFLEAEAAGLPCLVSEAVSAEAVLVKPLVQRLSLAEPAARWAEAILAARELEMPRSEALGIMAQSKFNIESSCRELVEFYLNQLNKVGVSNG